MFKPMNRFTAIILMVLVAVIASAGPAVAKHLITGRDILDNTVTNKDIRNGTVGEFDLNAPVRTKLNNIGRTGPVGPQGERGATGATGIQGPAGPKGADGQDGTNGKPGKNGADGKDGSTGPQGEQGIPGVKGDTGPAGSVSSTYTSNGKNEGNGLVTFKCVGDDLILSVIPFDNQDRNATHVSSVELDQSSGFVRFVSDNNEPQLFAGIGVAVICAKR